MKALVLRLAASLATGLAVSCAWAQAWPAKPIKLVVGFPPGVSPELASRILAARMTESLGQAVIVENRPGAIGTIAAFAVANAAPDGYTILVGLAANLGTGPHLMPAAKYDPVKSFAPIGFIQRGPYFVTVRSDLPVRTFQEFIDYAKKNPGKLNIGVPGAGSVHHLSWESLMSRLGFKVTIIPVAGTAQEVTETLAGRLDGFMDNAGSVVAAQVRAGKFRFIAMTGLQRTAAQFPEVPTLDELGVKGFESYSWWGLAAPAGTPPEIVARLNAELNKALEDPQLKERLANEGVPPERVRGGKPEEFGAWVASEHARWGKVIKDRGIKLQ